MTTKAAAFSGGSALKGVERVEGAAPGDAAVAEGEEHGTKHGIDEQRGGNWRGDEPERREQTVAADEEIHAGERGDGERGGKACAG